jgi:hypothetical protein
VVQSLSAGSGFSNHRRRTFDLWCAGWDPGLDTCAIRDGVATGLLPADRVHYITRYLQQQTESVYFRLKRTMARVDCLRSFYPVRGMIAGFEGMLWLWKDFAFSAEMSCSRSSPDFEA